MDGYEIRKARAIAPVAPKRSLTEYERAARNYDWREYLVIIFQPKVKRLSIRTTRVERIEALPLDTHPDDANYRAGLRLRKGETIKEVRPV